MAITQVTVHHPKDTLFVTKAEWGLWHSHGNETGRLLPYIVFLYLCYMAQKYIGLTMIMATQPKGWTDEKTRIDWVFLRMVLRAELNNNDKSQWPSLSYIYGSALSFGWLCEHFMFIYHWKQHICHICSLSYTVRINLFCGDSSCSKLKSFEFWAKKISSFWPFIIKTFQLHLNSWRFSCVHTGTTTQTHAHNNMWNQHTGWRTCC